MLYDSFGDMPEIPGMKDLPEDEREKYAKRGCITYIVALLIGLLVCAIFNSCTTTQYVPVDHYHTDTLRITQTQRDSIYLHDSVSVKERGDTVKIERWRTRYIERTKHDTVYQATHDTIPQPYPVIKEPPVRLSLMQRSLIVIGILSIIVAVLIVVTKIKDYLP